jgi:N-acetylglutamate synthase/N-acetylornithine aminotransferase
MPKTKLERMGHCWDINFRLKSVRKYLADKVKQARKIIYKSGQAVAGTGVDGVLKSTSSVPVIVSALPCHCVTIFN